MSEKVTVQSEIPLTWRETLEQVAQKRNQSLDMIIAEAIAYYLGEDPLGMQDRLHTAETEIATLSQGLAELTASLEGMQQRLITAASVMGTPFSATPPRKAFPATPFEIDEEIEDEPDEILYDFLEPER